eukprot:GGOE01012112.1.p1 GENE.GGOE01012112.1~~GGOE01012112.1.p1  ORF type:complete len:770 (-),score=170.18 GGOE01012112.1:693-2981(-)
MDDNSTNLTMAAKIAELEAFTTTAAAQYKQLSVATDAAWILGCSVLLFGMQIGFTLVEAGCVKSNLRSILMKNVITTGLCTLMWWFIGNALMRGSVFCSFASIDVPFQIIGTYVSWFWDVSFVCASTTIVSGAMAERVKVVGYSAFVLWLSGFIYPFVAQWEWTTAGFLAVSNPNAVLPMLDYAGCGGFHLVGGIASLVGAWMVGPRAGAFMDEMPVFTKKEHMVQDRLAATQSLYSVIGVMVLWIAWYGFNCGSAGGIVGKVDIVGLVAVNTTVSAMVGAMVASAVSYFQYRLFKVDVVLMGILSGLVSITGCAPWVQTYMAVPIAIVGFLVYHFLVWLLVKLRIDDPVAAFPIHGGCGLWGLLAPGFFYDTTLCTVVTNSRGIQVRNQFLGALIIAGWSLALSLAGLIVLQLLLHGLRNVDAEAEFRRDAGLQNAQGPRGTVTLLFTDIQSSTVLWQADEECMEEALAMHDHVFRTALQAFNGFEVKTEGDAFMCAFSSTADCARFCVAVQHRLMEVKWPRSLYTNVPARVEDDGFGQIIWKGLRVRMGFHTGEPSTQENPLTQRTDYLGKDVNYASRVSAVGAGGQILLSSASAKELLAFCQDVGVPLEDEEPFGLIVGERHSLPALECALEYIGRRPLKGIASIHADGEHLYQLRPLGLDSRVFAPAPGEVPKTADSFRCNRWENCQPSPSPKSPRSELSGAPSSPRNRRPRQFALLQRATAISPADPLVSQQAWSPGDLSAEDPGTPLMSQLPVALP